MPGVCGDLYNLFFNFVPIRGGQRPGQAAQLARCLVTDVVSHFCNTNFSVTSAQGKKPSQSLHNTQLAIVHEKIDEDKVRSITVKLKE